MLEHAQTSCMLASTLVVRTGIFCKAGSELALSLQTCQGLERCSESTCALCCWRFLACGGSTPVMLFTR